MRLTRPFRSLAIVSFLCGSLLTSVCAAAQQAGSLAASGAYTTAFPRGVTMYSLPQTISTSGALAQTARTQPQQAISLTSGHFGIAGKDALATGYASGMIGIQDRNEEDGMPFVAKTRLVDAGLKPDLLVSGDVDGNGAADLVAASRNGAMIAVLSGDGQGGFKHGRLLPTGGTVTSLAVWYGADGHAQIAAGVCGVSRCYLEILQSSGKVIASIALQDRPSILRSARLNLRAAEDLIVGSSSLLTLIDGTSVHAATPRLTTLPVSGAVAATTGVFVYDRRFFPQIAVLTGDGSVLTLVRTGLDSSFPVPTGHHNARHKAATSSPNDLGWVIAETLAGVGPSGQGDSMLLRGRISGSGMDDLIALGGVRGDATTIGHPIVGAMVDGNYRNVALPARVAQENLTGGAGVTAAFATRVSQDARMGLVSVSAAAGPAVAQLAAYHTLNVIVANDVAAPSACAPTDTTTFSCPNLRSAILQVNADSAYNEANGTADVVNVPAETYNLIYSAGSEPDTNGNRNYHMEVTGPMSLIGAGPSKTILSGLGKDKIFSINSGYTTNLVQTPMDTFISGVQFQQGTNVNSTLVNANAHTHGGALDVDTGGAGNITIVNSQFVDDTTQHGSGGAIFASDLFQSPGSSGPGILEVDNTIFTTNSANVSGGAIATAESENSLGNLPVLLNGDTFTANQAGTTGGAVLFAADLASGKSSTISSSSFGGNGAVLGGGIYAGSGLRIAGNLFTSNSVIAGGSDPSEGGAIWQLAQGQPPSITGNYFAQNGAGDYNEGHVGYGPAIFLSDLLTPAGHATTSTIRSNYFWRNYYFWGDNGGSVQVNTARDDEPTASVDASENFWGCNEGPNAGVCDTAGVASPGGGGALKLTPYLLFSSSISPNPTTVGNAVTLAGGFTTDSAGNSASISGMAPFPYSYSFTLPGQTTVSGSGTASGAATLSQNFTPTVTGIGSGVLQLGDLALTAPFTVGTGKTAPTVSLSVTPDTILPNGSSTIVVSVSNSTSVAFSGIAFSVSVAGSDTPVFRAVTNQCGGTVTSFTKFSGISLAANSSCQARITIVAASAGRFAYTTNTLTATSPAASGTVSNTANLTVVSTPAISVAFIPSTIPNGGTSTLIHTLTNQNSIDLTGAAFSNTLPANLLTTGAVTNTCGGDVTITSNRQITLNGGTIPANTDCTVAVDVTSSVAGSYSDRSGPVSTTNGGSNGAQSTAASLRVAEPLSINAAFIPNVVAPKAVTMLQLTVLNSGSTALSSVAFSNSIPSGLTYMSANAACGGTAAVSSGVVNFAGLTVPAQSSCVVTIVMSSATSGTYSDTTGVPTSSNGGVGVASNTATLTITPGGNQSITINPLIVPFGTKTVPLTVQRAFNGATVPTGALGIGIGGETVAATCTGSTSPQTCTYPNYPLTSLSAGSYTISASSNGDGNYASASATSTLTITSAAAPVVSVDDTSVAYGTASVSLSAQIAYTGSSRPAGAFSFSVGSGAAITATCAGAASPLTCAASYPAGTLAVSSYRILGSFAGDANYSPAAGSGTLMVTRATAPTVYVPNVTAALGAANTTLTAQVTYTGGGPLGALSFTVGSGSAVGANCIGSTSPQTCSASYSTGSLAAGAYQVTANLAGTINYPAAAGMGTLTVSQAAAPSVTVSNVSGVYGATLTLLSAQVTFAGPGPIGSLTFTIDSGAAMIAACSGTNSPLTCSAQYPTGSLAAGSHRITGSLASTTNYPATSATGTLSVMKASTGLGLVLNPAGSSLPGQAVTLMATLTTSSGQVSTADGELVSFTVNGIPLGSGQLSKGAATLRTTTLPAGSDVISAAYLGDSNFLSSSAQAIEQVNPVTVRAVVNVPAQTFVPGAATSPIVATIAYSGPSPSAAIAMQIDDGQPLNGTCTVTVGDESLNCVVQYPTASLSAETHRILVTLLADGVYGVTQGTGSLAPGTAKPSIAITIPAQTGTAMATVVPVTATGVFEEGVFPTGTTVITIDGVYSMNAACSLLSDSSATCMAQVLVPGGLSAGRHTVSVSVAGDQNYSTSTGSGVLTAP